MKAKKEKDLIKALEIYYENNPLTGPPISADSEEEWLKYGMDEWNDEDWIRYRVLMKSILTRTEQSTRIVKHIMDIKKKEASDKEFDIHLNKKYREEQ